MTTPSPAEVYARFRDAAAPPGPVVLACRGCKDLTDQVLALSADVARLTRDLHSAIDRADVLADSEAETRKANEDKDASLCAANLKLAAYEAKYGPPPAAPLRPRCQLNSACLEPAGHPQPCGITIGPPRW